MLIDDEDSLRRTVGFGLMQRGYDAELCENGMRGLQTLESYRKKNMPLGCAIVDIRLPDIDGLKLLKVIRFNYPGLPVVIITGHGNEKIAQEAKAADGYLEKPFDMDDLAKLLEDIPEAKAGEVQKTEESTPAQSFSAYALITLTADANLMEVYRRLYFSENTVYCDAVRGDCDLMVLVQGESPEKVALFIENEIKVIPGVAQVAALTVDAPVFAENVADILGSVDKALGPENEDEIYTNQTARVRASSYVTLEIEREKLQNIYPALYFNDNVVYSDCTKGKYDIVMLVKGTSFADIDNTIKTRIKPLDGVLRIKEWPILTLFDM